jgi:hypothetical protein
MTAAIWRSISKNPNLRKISLAKARALPAMPSRIRFTGFFGNGWQTANCHNRLAD